MSSLVELHLRFHGYGSGEWTDSAVRRYVRDAGDQLERLHVLTRADCTTRNQRKAERLRRTYDDLEERIARLSEQEELASIRPDLDGNQIMEILGIGPGRDVGEAYKFLLELRMDNGPMSEPDARAALEDWWAAAVTRLAERCPGVGHVALGSGPTPVRPLDLDLGVETWLKDESVFGDGDWGGNKVRKLEWIIPEAQRRGVSTLFTVGGIGTHWGLACALYAGRHGLETVLGLVDQPVDDHVREQLARLEASGAKLYRFASPLRLKLAAPYLLARHRPWYLPAGGSNAFGTLAYVDVALEIAEQVASGDLPEPATIVVPVGSGGTVTGLMLGLRMAGLDTAVLGVVVNDMIRLDAPAMARLATKTTKLLTERGAADVPVLSGGDFDLRPDWLGAMYGDPTPASMAEVDRAAAEGLALEPVYTGKALAAVRELGATLPGPVLWLNTHGPR